MTLRIVATGDLLSVLQAQGWSDARIRRVMKHGQVDHTHRTPPVLDEQGNVITPAGPATRTFDILVDRDSGDLPPAVVTFLRNQASIIYVAEWDMQATEPYNATTNPDGYRIWKGVDPGHHRFAGWPC